MIRSASDTSIYYGDCLQIMPDIPDKSVDMILCDLPYGTTACKWDSIIPIAPLWEQYRRVIKDNGAIVLTGTPPFTAAMAYNAVDLFRYSWYWIKPHTGQLNVKKMPLKNVEEILVFYKRLPTYNPQFETGKPYTINRKNYKGSECYGAQRDHTTVNNGSRHPKQVLQFALNEKRLHPTQKPVALLEYLIKTYTNEGDLVLDNAMGSGSTGIACINTERRFIGIELNYNYFDIAEKRIQEALEMNI